MPENDFNAIWKPVQGFDRDYFVSNMGDVSIGVGVLDQEVNGNGYCRVSLLLDGTPKKILIQQLALKAFLGIHPEWFHCAHKNGEPVDNRISNLEWSKFSENKKSVYVDDEGNSLMYGENHPRAKLTVEKVKEIRSQPMDRKEWWRLGKKFGVKTDTIKNAATHNTWKSVP